MRIGAALILTAIGTAGLTMLLVTADRAMAQAGAQRRAATQAAAQPARPRVRIYGTNRPLSPNARRQCEAWYEQEFRPSGPVVVPRMNCFWVGG
ncbi:MAG TPA: hypothetical protein VNZ94_06195 [Xanthobacteraceae bacterium]|nr:hypothetical protein [Xanthobacteraceae bacterium]